MPLKNNQTSAYTYLAWVTFELEQGKKLTAEIPSGTTTALPGTPSVFSIQTQKSLQQPEGKFQITLSAIGVINDELRSWINVLRPNDRVEIKLARRSLSAGSLPDEEQTVMIGLIDRVTEQRGVDPHSGQPVMVATVNGTDYVKIFKQAKFSNDMLLLNVREVLSRIKLLNDAVELRITDAEQITEILKFARAHGVFDLHLAGTEIRPSPDGERQAPLRPIFNIEDGRFLAHQGDLWELLQLLANAPFCELYLDCIRDRPTLVFRPTPFGPPGPKQVWPEFRNLHRHVLTRRHYWSTRNLQRSAADLLNVFLVYTQILKKPLQMLPVKVDESLRLYGLRYCRPYVTILPAMAAAQQAQDNAAKGTDRTRVDETDWDVANEELFRQNMILSEVLAEWFGRKSQFEAGAKQPLFKSGVLPIVLSPKIRIGQAAEMPDLKEIYYIEGVTHRIQVKQSAQTVLTLTRGQKL